MHLPVTAEELLVRDEADWACCLRTLAAEAEADLEADLEAEALVAELLKRKALAWVPEVRSPEVTESARACSY